MTLESSDETGWSARIFFIYYAYSKDLIIMHIYKHEKLVVETVNLISFSITHANTNGLCISLMKNFHGS